MFYSQCEKSKSKSGNNIMAMGYCNTSLFYAGRVLWPLKKSP